MHPHVLLPFVVEHAGALGKDAMKHFQHCRKIVANQLSVSDEDASTWSSKGFTNFYLCGLSMANLKGLGHFFHTASNVLRTAAN